MCPETVRLPAVCGNEYEAVYRLVGKAGGRGDELSVECEEGSPVLTMPT